MACFPFDLQDRFVVFDGEKRAAAVPVARAVRDGGAGFTVGIFAFTDDASVHADHWERHPDGDEVLCVLEGCLVVTIEGDGTRERSVILEKGQALIVPQARWHRLLVVEPGRLLVCTPRSGTALRRVESAEAVAVA
jgi:mannose-6-phosphate isomerase-like protein (cupin superfamily)